MVKNGKETGKMQIDIDVPDGRSGDWAVETFTVLEKEAEWFNLREAMHRSRRTIVPGTYKKLTHHGSVIMSNTPAEIRDHFPIIHRGKGHVEQWIRFGSCNKSSSWKGRSKNNHSY